MATECHTEEEREIAIVISEETDKIQPEPTVEVIKDNFSVDKTDLSIGYEAYEIPEYGGMKKWESCRCFDSNTKQKQLQQLAETDKNGIRTVNGRYCVALGTHFTENIGQYVDLILENGEVIPCVLADVKAPQHTDKNNIFSVMNKNKCASEFVVDPKTLNAAAKYSGDISSIKDEWKSRVVSIVVYNINIFGGVEEIEKT